MKGQNRPHQKLAEMRLHPLLCKLKSSTIPLFFRLWFLVFLGGMSLVILLIAENAAASGRCSKNPRPNGAAVRFHTVRFHPKSAPLSYPVLAMGSQNSLVLRFDELYHPIKNYRYRIVRCNREWEESLLAPSQYFEGFQTHYIEEVATSFNTYVPYTHYRCEIPRQGDRFLLPGNYKVQILNETEEQPLLERRFLVYRQRVGITPNLHTATLARYFRSHQELDFQLDYRDLPIQDPYLDIYVMLLQNHRWPLARKGLRPTQISGSRLTYDYEEENLFPGGNEFRPLDLRNLRTPGRGTAGSRLDSLFFIATNADEARERYSFIQDNNGFSLIVNRQNLDPSTEADYALVEFVLKDHPAIPSQADVYVQGGFNHWSYHDTARMNFDPKTRRFRKRLLLKQGYHDYQYSLRMPDGRLLPNRISGNFADTENTYEILVYVRSRTLNTFLLYGYQRLSSEGF